MKKLRTGLNILVTAGPTREPIDPVRFISNYSTGFLGYEIAKEASRRGHRVILISGPVASTKPQGICSIDIETARQMEEKIKTRFSWCDCLIMTAAICDFRAEKIAKKKIKTLPAGRQGGAKKEIALRLKQNPDILKGLGRRKGKRILVGFALETENLKKNAQDKLRQKNLDLIVATQMKSGSYPFGQVKLDSLIIDKNGHLQQVGQATKAQLARILLEKIENLAMS